MHEKEEELLQHEVLYLQVPHVLMYLKRQLYIGGR